MEPEPPLPPRHLTDRVRRALERISVGGEAEAAIPLAQTLFQEVYDAAPADVGASSTFVPLIAEHTHYFGGFGLLMRMPGGVAVAAGPSQAGHRIVVSGGDEATLKQLVELLHGRVPDPDRRGLDLAVVCAAAAGDDEALLAAAGIAFFQAIGYAEDAESMVPLVTAAVEEVLGRPYGPAYVLAGLDDWPLVLIDAGTNEHVGLSRPESLGAAVIELGRQHLPPPATFHQRQALLERSIQRLREHGHAGLTSLRNLEHQELPNALAVVGSAARPFLRHMATEDRRVPRMVAAVRREDPQVLGALLLMSHASWRDDAKASIEEVEYVVGRAEGAEGIYGARMAGAGYGGRVVVVGRPFLLPDIMDEIAEAYHGQFGLEPSVTLL